MAAAFRPQYRSTCNTTIFSVTKKLNAQAKMVVLQAEVQVEIVKRSEKIVKLGPIPGVSLGTTTVRLRCGGNKVQYYIPLDRVTERNFSFDAATGQLVVSLPAPVLDESIVEVQSDPAKMEIQTEVGWGRLEAYSGKALRDLALQELRAAVLQEGASDLHRQVAKMEADKQVRAFLAPLAGQLRADVKLTTEFR